MVEFGGQTMNVELQIRNKLPCLSLDLVVRVHILLCHNFSMQPCCAIKKYECVQKKKKNPGHYLLFTISTWELENKGNGQVHTLFKKNGTILLPLP